MGRSDRRVPPTDIRLRMPCEVVREHLLPLIRRLLAHELVRRHGLSQVRAARMLDVTQPAVSSYLRSDPEVGEALREAVEEVRGAVRELSEDLLEGRITQVEALERVCALCVQMRNRGPICVIHGEVVPSLNPDRCSLCLTDLTAIKRRALEEYEIVEDVRSALRVIEGTRELSALIPEIGMNIAYAKPGATGVEEVVGVPGRIRPIGGRPRASRPPEFGGSSHTARALLTLMRFDPSLRSAMSLKFDWEVVEICRDLGLAVSFFDRTEEPPEVKRVDGRTIPWGVRRAVERLRRAPEVIYDLGDVGKEPMIFLFGHTPLEVAQLAARIAEEYAKRRSPKRDG